jgi:hypothetical protein
MPIQDDGQQELRHKRRANECPVASKASADAPSHTTRWHTGGRQGRRHDYLRDLWQDIQAACYPEAAQASPQETVLGCQRIPDEVLTRWFHKFHNSGLFELPCDNIGNRTVFAI